MGTAPDTAHATLLVPVHRGWDHVAALLGGLGAPWPDGLEVVVVDDASGDGGAEELRRRFPAVALEVREHNGGFAAAVNTGVARARGDVLVVANSDLVLPPAAVTALVALAGADRTTVFGPRTVRPDGREIQVAHRFPTPGGDAAELFVPLRVLRRVLHARGHANPPGAGPVRCDWVLGACLAFHRDVWDRAGTLDEDFHMYSEEVDWQRRGAARGVTAAYVPDVTVRHDESHGTEAAGRAADQRFRAIWRSRLRYHLRHGGRAAGLRLRVLWVLGFAVSGPAWLALALVPRWRPRALAELRRAGLLAYAALRPRALR